MLQYPVLLTAWLISAYIVDGLARVDCIVKVNRESTGEAGEREEVEDNIEPPAERLSGTAWGNFTTHPINYGNLLQQNVEYWTGLGYLLTLEIIRERKR